MPQLPVHAQPAAVLTERRREITKRAADLCRAQPAVFAAVVRQADRLRAQGWATRTRWTALAAFGYGPPVR